MRTVKRHTLPLNKTKLTKLGLLIDAYVKEKQHWLVELQSKANRGLIRQHRVIRDHYVKNGYRSVGGLQARMWKLALTDACETMDGYLQSRFDALRKTIYHKKWDSNQKHYANWLLSDYQRVFSLFDGVIPTFDSKNRMCDISHQSAKQVINFVRKSLSIILKTVPTAKNARSFILDSTSYGVYYDAVTNTQYLSVMGLEARKRIVIPLKGQQRVSGTIRVVTDDRVNYCVHVVFDVSPDIVSDDAMEIEALDFGYTEVATNQNGTRYGVNLGQMLTDVADDRTDKGRKRNKLRTIANKAFLKGDVRKARRIKRNNLGQVKWKAREHDAKSTIDLEFNFLTEM